MNIGIIFGGKSFEHEISIISAYQLKKKIEDRYKVKLFYIDIDSNLYVADGVNLSDFKQNKLRKLKKIRFDNIKCDCLVSVMHGENGEDGVLASLCKYYNIALMGCDTFTGSLCIDKYYTYKYLSNNGIDMIDSVLYTYDDYLNDKKIDYMPCIIKPCCLGSSLGIRICKSSDELDNLLIESFRYSKRVVIQPFYEGIMEYNLALNESCYSNLETINKKGEIFSFDNKYSDSFKQLHQALIDNERYNEFCDIARNVYNLIGASGIIRIDFFIHNDKILVNEINTTPGALAMYLFTDFNRVFDESLKAALSKENVSYEKGNFLTTSKIDK